MARDNAEIVTALAQDRVEIFNAVEILLDNNTLRFWTGYGKRALGSPLSANQIQIGDEYIITSVGDTDFTLIGAAENVAGTIFYATDRAVGTGTVSRVYTGAGQLMSISGLTEVSDLSAQSATLTFSGIPSDVIGLALREPYQRRECKIYFGIASTDWILQFGEWDDTGVWIDTSEWNDGPPDIDAADLYYATTEIFSGEMDTINISDSPESSIIQLSVASRLIKLDRANNRRYTAENHKSRHPNDTFFDTLASLQDVSIIWGGPSSESVPPPASSSSSSSSSTSNPIGR